MKPAGIVEVASVAADDSALIEPLLRDHLRELDRYRDPPVRSESYPYFDLYWSESARHPFVVRADGAIIGFAFVRGPESTGTGSYELAELYIAPAHRRRGFGRAALRIIWRKFPGPWELRVHCDNVAAVDFWRSSVQLLTGSSARMHEFVMGGVRRLRLEFTIDPPGDGEETP